MYCVAIIIFLILITTSLLHFYWGFGGKWQARNRIEFFNMVVGGTGVKFFPPRFITLSVAFAIFICALSAFLPFQTRIPLSNTLTIAILGVLSLVFSVRGIASYLFRDYVNKVPQPFRYLNDVLYSPLCIIIGAGYAALAIFAT